MSLLFLLVAAHFAARVQLPNAKTTSNKPLAKLLIAVVASGAAKFSFGYGLTALPVITLHGVLARWPLRAIFLSAFCSVILIAAYYMLFGLGGRSPAPLLNPLDDMPGMLSFVARFLAGAIAASGLLDVFGVSRISAAWMTGLGLLSIYSFGAARLYRKSLLLKQPIGHKQSVSLIVTTFCVAIALITWMSRSFESVGLVDRYYVVSVIFVLSLPGIFFVDPNSFAKRAIYSNSVLALGVAFLGVSLLGNLVNVTQPLHRWHLANTAAIAAELTIHASEFDVDVGPMLHEDRAKVESVWLKHRTRMRDHENNTELKWLGRELSSVFGASRNRRCTGYVNLRSLPGDKDTVFFNGENFTRPGWVEATDWIVVSNQDDRIVGLGVRRPGPELQDSISLYHAVSISRGFSFAGFLRSGPGTDLRFYSVDADGLCQIAGIQKRAD